MIDWRLILSAINILEQQWGTGTLYSVQCSWVEKTFNFSVNNEGKDELTFFFWFKSFVVNEVLLLAINNYYYNVKIVKYIINKKYLEYKHEIVCGKYLILIM